MQFIANMVVSVQQRESPIAINTKPFSQKPEGIQPRFASNAPEVILHSYGNFSANDRGLAGEVESKER